MSTQGFSKRRKLTIDVSDIPSAVETARAKYAEGNFPEAFDIYEQLYTTYPQYSIEILSEAYGQYQQMQNKSRYALYQQRIFDFNIKEGEKVLDIGSGHNPFPLATHLADIAITDHDYGRAGVPFKFVKGKPYYEFDVENIPFADKEFDFIYCSHVLEHAKNPARACEELMRVGKRGYIETPGKAKDLWLNSAKISNHNWYVEFTDDTLVFTEYTEEEICGLGSDVLMQMHTAPASNRERAFSALIYLKPEFMNTMMIWNDRFNYSIKKRCPRLEDIFLESSHEKHTEEEPLQQDYIQQDNTPANLSQDSQCITMPEPSTSKLKFFQVGTFYDAPLNLLYNKQPGLKYQSFAEQMKAIQLDGFSAVHLLAPYMNDLGYESMWVIANSLFSQLKWAEEQGITTLNKNTWMTDLVNMQIEYFKPDILYTNNPIVFDSKFISSLTYKPRLIIGYLASDLPAKVDWSEFDLILSPLSLLREEALRRGAKEALHFKPGGFPIWIYETVKDIQVTDDLTFCGQWTMDQHQSRNQLLEYIAVQAKNKLSTAFYLSGQTDKISPLVNRLNRGSRFGIEMHKAIKSGKIAFDARGDIRSFRNAGSTSNTDLAKNETANMRIFEATGTGVFLLTEYKENLNQYFDIGKEIETYSSKTEMMDKIRYYSTHDSERESIAERGRIRCHSTHSSKQKSEELDRIIKERFFTEQSEVITGETMSEFNGYFIEAYDLYIAKKYKESLRKLLEAECIYDGHNEGEMDLTDLNILRGAIYLELNELEEAKDSYEKALNLNPESAEACIGLGNIFSLCDMKEEAKTMFDWAMKFTQFPPKIEIDCKAEWFGNQDNEGFDVATEDINENSVIYSLGVGEDVGFDLAIIEKFGAVVHAFDPTPKSIDWVNNQILPDQFVMHDYGVAGYDGEISFNPPENPDYVSCTVLDRPATKDKAIVVPVKKLGTIMKELGHSHIDVLKMNIEGSEYQVISDMLASNILPKQILVEFHHRFIPENGLNMTKESIQMLRQSGYRIFSISDTHEEYSFKLVG